MTTEFVNIPIRDIEVDFDANPRKEMDNTKYTIEQLAKNIEEISLLNPITVERIDDGKYILIAGYRRLKAFEILYGKYKDTEEYKNKYASIPAIVKEDVQDQLFIALSENLSRKDMTEDEKAKGIYSYKEATADTVRKIAYKLGISKSYVNKLYQRGKLLANPTTPSAINTEERKFNPDKINALMQNTTSTINEMKDISRLDATGKITLRDKSKKIIEDLQLMISYMRETEKMLLDEDVKELMKEQKQAERNKEKEQKPPVKRGRPPKNENNKIINIKDIPKK